MFDLGIWKSSPGLSVTSASFIYNALCRGETSAQVLAAAPAIEAFHADLTETWPELPGPLHRIGNAILLSCQWQDAELVLAYVTALAEKHGLTVFDPQSEELHP